MKFSVRHTQGVAIFEIDGKIIGNDSMLLWEAINRAIEAYAAPPKLLFNLDGVSLMDSTGLETLIRAYVLVMKSGGCFGLTGMSDAVRRLLVLTKLISVLPHFESEAKAIDLISGC